MRPLRILKEITNNSDKIFWIFYEIIQNSVKNRTINNSNYIIQTDIRSLRILIKPAGILSRLLEVVSGLLSILMRSLGILMRSLRIVMRLVNYSKKIIKNSNYRCEIIKNPNQVINSDEVTKNSNEIQEIFLENSNRPFNR